MIINGKQISEEIRESLREQISTIRHSLRLDIVYVGNDPVIENFLKIKINFGKSIGVETVLHRFDENEDEADIVSQIETIGKYPNSNGMIIQLPLPKKFDTQKILNTVPLEKDVDVLSEKAFEYFTNNDDSIIPPVAGAFMEILRRNNISVAGKKVVIIGRGRLVGKPFSVCMKKAGADIIELNSTTGDPTPYLLSADIIATGIGKPHFIKPDMIHDGVIILDGGTSEKEGKIVGDADPSCAEKCSIFTPVPGGIGPITVALLFQNLVSKSNKD